VIQGRVVHHFRFSFFAFHMPANIHTIDALKEAKAALATFAEEAGALLANVDSDIARMGQWLTHERPAHWKSQVRKRDEAVQAARQEISRKQLAAAPDPASTVLERKALARCLDKLSEAQRRQQNTRRWIGVWDKESLSARGSISQLAEFVRADIPKAIARIDRMMEQVEDYLSLAAPQTNSPTLTPSSHGGDADSSMARPLDDRPPDRSFAHLRPLAAEAVTRAKSPRDPIDWSDLTLELLDDQTRAQIADLAIHVWVPDPRASIVVAANALGRPALWLLRLPPQGPTDSGWFLGPLEAPDSTGACWRVPLSEFLEARPDLQPLLGSAVGTLAVLGPGGPLAVVDPAGKNVWLADD
jgi:hypothetical protein